MKKRSKPHVILSIWLTCLAIFICSSPFATPVVAQQEASAGVGETAAENSIQAVAETVGTIINGETYYIRNRQSGRYLDIYLDGTAAGTHVQVYDRNYAWLTEQWEFTLVENGDYKIRVKHTADRYLDGRFNCVDGAQAVIFYWENQAEQKWKVTHVGGGYFTLQPRRNTSLYLTASGTGNNAKVKVNNYTGGAEQQWYLELKDKATIQPADDWMDLAMMGNTRQLYAAVWGTNQQVRWYSTNTAIATVDVYSGLVTGKSVGDVAIYCQPVADSGVSKRGYFTMRVRASPTPGIISGGVYCIRNERSGKYLDADIASSNVQQWTLGNMANQMWVVNFSSAGYYTLTPKYNAGYRLDVGGASNVHGANIGVYSANNTNAQRFYIWMIQGKGSALIPLCATDKRVEVAGRSTADGANVQIYQRDDSNTSQFWRFGLAYPNDTVYNYINPSASANSFYNRTEAKNYTNIYAMVNNSYYYTCSPDCANFASQCMRAGGMYEIGRPMVITPLTYYDRIDITKWFNVVNNGDDGVSRTWSSATNQRRHFGQRSPSDVGRAYKYFTFANATDALNNFEHLIKILQPGDIFYLADNTANTADHTMVIYRKTTDDVRYSQHSDRRHDVSLRDLLQNYKNTSYGWDFILIKHGE